MGRGCCCVSGCPNQSGHTFPKDPVLKNLWLNAVQSARPTPTPVTKISRKSNSWPPGKYAIICGDHFDETCYNFHYTKGYDSSTGGIGLCKIKLKCDAVPTIFPLQVEKNTKVMKTRSHSKDRASKIMRITSMELDLGKERSKMRPLKREAARESYDETKTGYQLPVNKKIKFDKVLKKIETNDLTLISANDLTLISANISPLKTSTSKLETPQTNSPVEVSRVNSPTLEKLSSTETPYKCSHCAKTFPRRNQLELHKFDHVRATTNCDVCKTKTFKSLYELSNHQRTHRLANISKVLEVGFHICSQCKASFTTETILDHHTATCHNSRCDECERSFPSLSQVTAHKQRCHVKVVSRPITKVVPVVLRQVCATCKSIRCRCEGGPKGSGKLLMSRKVTASLKMVAKPVTSKPVEAKEVEKPVGAKMVGSEVVKSKVVGAKPAENKLDGLKRDFNEHRRTRGDKEKTASTVSQQPTTAVPFARITILNISEPTKQDVESIATVDPLAFDPLASVPNIKTIMPCMTNIAPPHETKQLGGVDECNPLDFLHIEMN